MFFKSEHTDVPTPELSFKETEALIRVFNEEGQSHGTNFSRFDGVLTALLATRNAPAEQVWELADYAHAPSELREQAAPYIRSSAALMAAGYLSPQMENCRPTGNFSDWLSGVGDVLGLVPEKAMVLVSYPDEEVSGATLPALMLARRNQFLHTDEKSRQDVLKGLHEMDDDARLTILMDLPAALMSLYGDPDMEQVAREQFGGGRILRAGVRGQPVRREGKKVLPNAPCPCGSGKKYKKCCGASGAA